MRRSTHRGDRSCRLRFVAGTVRPRIIPLSPASSIDRWMRQ
jgi:hypothetical protein